MAHGLQGYLRDRCRCDVCKDAWAGAMRRYRSRHPEHKQRRNARRNELARERKGLIAAGLPYDWTY